MVFSQTGGGGFHNVFDCFGEAKLEKEKHLTTVLHLKSAFNYIHMCS